MKNVKDKFAILIHMITKTLCCTSNGYLYDHWNVYIAAFGEILNFHERERTKTTKQSNARAL